MRLSNLLRLRRRAVGLIIIPFLALALASPAGAEISTKHANFIVAHPGCRADDVLKLIKIIREKVFDKNQIHLESEVQIWP